MTRIQLSDNGTSPFEKLIGHNKEILDQWIALEESIIQDSSLSVELLEQVRRTLALGNQCEYCMVKGGLPDVDEADQRAQLATAFAELFAMDHKSIVDGHYDMLREEFTEAEISELCSFISFTAASQKLGRVFNLSEDFQENKVISMKELNKALSED